MKNNLDKKCPLCDAPSENILWTDKNCRIIRVTGESLGLHRVIWNEHLEELSDLSSKELLELMNNVLKLEVFIKSKYFPHKINVASLGNQVPHIHIHVCPRWKTDPWWPGTIWSSIRDPNWNVSWIPNAWRCWSLVLAARLR